MAAHVPATSPRESQYRPAAATHRPSKSLVEERQVERQQSTSKLTAPRAADKKAKPGRAVPRGGGRGGKDSLLGEAPSAGSNHTLPTSPRSGTGKKARPAGAMRPALQRAATATTIISVDRLAQPGGPETPLSAVPLESARSLDQYRDALRAENPSIFPAGAAMELVFVDDDGDWLVLDAEVPWKLVVATAKRLLVVS